MKIQKKKFGRGGGGGWVRGGGGGGGGSGWEGVRFEGGGRVDVYGEVKLL